MKRLLPIIYFLLTLGVMEAWFYGIDNNNIPSKHTDNMAFNLSTDSTEFPSLHVLQTTPIG